MRIRAKTFKQWLKVNFTRNQLKDMAMHGANTGWHGLCYTRDIIKLYAKYKEEIWQHLCEESESAGYNNPFEFIATFNGAKNVCDVSDMETLMVYYTAESFAYRMSENLD